MVLGRRTRTKVVVAGRGAKYRDTMQVGGPGSVIR